VHSATSASWSSTSSTAESKPPAIAAGAVIRRYAGSGNGMICTLSATKAIVFDWMATKPPIKILLPNGFVLLRSDARAGRGKLTPGTYPGMRIETNGGGP
jgi:hypothetical protein